MDRDLELVLAGSMQGYRWTIKGERVAIHFENRNGMGHPMHLHGHVFQVVEINGQVLRLPPERYGSGAAEGHVHRPA